MRFLRYTLIIAISTIALSVSAKNEMKTVYLFGFAASFNDSTVYFTDVQEVDSAYIDTKTNFLTSRENYSYQLRNYLASRGENNRTCIVTYDTKRENAEKKLNKMKNRYATIANKKHNSRLFKSSKAKNAEQNTKNEEKNNFDIRYITSADFRFKPVTPYVVEEAEAEAAKLSKEKKNKKSKDEQSPKN